MKSCLSVLIHSIYWRGQKQTGKHNVILWQQSNNNKETIYSCVSSRSKVAFILTTPHPQFLLNNVLSTSESSCETGPLKWRRQQTLQFEYLTEEAQPSQHPQTNILLQYLNYSQWNTSWVLKLYMLSLKHFGPAHCTEQSINDISLSWYETMHHLWFLIIHVLFRTVNQRAVLRGE